MLRRMVALFLFIGLALAAPLAALADQQPISGVPTWQNVPDTSTLQPGYYTTINGQEYWVQTQTVNGQTEPEAEYPVLGNQYGYYWTDTEGHLLFIIIDPATGNTIGAYSESSSANNGDVTTTKQVTQTIWNFTQVVPPIVMGVDYPAGNDGQDAYLTPWYNTNVLTVPTSLADPYQFFAFWVFNDNNFPINTQLMCNNGGVGGETTVSVQLPANWQGYVEIPISGLSYGSSYSFYPTADTSVQSAVGSDGEAYTLVSGSESYYYNAYENTQVQVAPYQGQWNIGAYDSGFYQLVPGFTSYKTFTPTLAANVGEEGTVQVATEVTTQLGAGFLSANYNGYTYIGNYNWQQEFQGSITISNPNPFPVYVGRRGITIEIYDGNIHYGSNGEVVSYTIPIGGNTISGYGSYTYSSTFTYPITCNGHGDCSGLANYSLFMYGGALGRGDTYYTNDDVALTEAYATTSYPTVYVEPKVNGGMEGNWYDSFVSPLYDAWTGGQPSGSTSLTIPVISYDGYEAIFSR